MVIRTCEKLYGTTCLYDNRTAEMLSKDGLRLVRKTDSSARDRSQTYAKWLVATAMMAVGARRLRTGFRNDHRRVTRSS